VITRFLRIRNWNIVSKIVGVNSLILLVSFSYLLFYIIPRYEQSIIEEHKKFTVSMVDIAHSVVDRQHQLELKGEFTRDEAQQRALAMIHQINNINGYFWIHTLDLVMVTHPLNRSLEGKNLAEYRDPDGFKLFVAMNDLIRVSGSGFIQYKWLKPSDGSIQSKISYLKGFQPWGWVIGSGLYLDDLNREVTLIRRQVAAITVSLLIGIVCFSLYAARRVNQPLRTALEITRSIAMLPPHEQVTTGTSSEPQLLLNAIESMVQELKKSKDEAESSNRAKSMFLAKMSHEIRTPMNAVIGMTELALESSVSVEQKEYLEGVRSSGEHLMQLINDILDISKIEAGHLQLEKTSFPLRQLIDNSMKPLEYRAQQKGLYCSILIDDSLPAQLCGDPLRLRQVITNLVGNAIKFTSHGGITLRVDREAVTETAVALILSVSDTGIGISDADRDHIFTPFVQANAAITRHYGGTGLGLSIVRQIVEMMGGGVTVASESGKGSTFSATLQFDRVENDKYSYETGMVEEQKLDQASSLPLRILVAEDVPLNQTLIMRLLEKSGHCVAIASNGLETIERWRRERFDLILMDILMPEMGGLEVTRIIRSEEINSGQQIPIIALTAQIMPDEITTCYEAGMNAYLAKPLSQAALVAALAPYICQQVDAAKKTGLAGMAV